MRVLQYITHNLSVAVFGYVCMNQWPTHLRLCIHLPCMQVRRLLMHCSNGCSLIYNVWTAGCVGKFTCFEWAFLFSNNGRIFKLINCFMMPALYKHVSSISTPYSNSKIENKTKTVGRSPAKLLLWTIRNSVMLIVVLLLLEHEEIWRIKQIHV